MKKSDYHFWKRKDFIYFQQKANERIRALEAEVKKWDEDAQEWAEAMAREKVRADALEAELAEWHQAKKFLGSKALDEWRGVVARLKKAEAERDALKDILKGRDIALGILKARVAELERVKAYESRKGGGRESGRIPPEGESGTVSPPTGRTASAADPVARVRQTSDETSDKRP